MNIVLEKPVSETYSTLMKVAWNFDYQGAVPKLDDLYNRAKENQWNATDLDWDTPIDPSNPIVASADSDYARMPLRSYLTSNEKHLPHILPRKFCRSFCMASRVRC